MEPRTIGVSLALCITPIFELRGAIPYALAQGANPVLTYFLCVAANACVAPLVYAFLGTIHKLLARSPGYKALFDRLIQRARRKVHGKVQRYGYVGLALFVAIPLPITGAYTGTLGAWVLGMKPQRVFLAVCAGVVVAGIVVTIVSYLGIAALAVFVT